MKKTIVIAEHRLHYLADLVDTFVCMENGSVTETFSASQFRALPLETVEKIGLRPVNFKQIKKSEMVKKKIREEITIKNFLFTYQKKEKPAINIHTLNIKKGEITAIVGSNGAGKSTFARCFCGLEKNFFGSITIDGKTYTKKELLQLTYMVLQDVNNQLFTESVEEELLLGNRQLSDDQLNDFLKEMNLSDVSDRHPLSLSGGQQQRLAIASALVSEKKIFILDEPTSGLDLLHMNKVVATLKKLRSSGRSILLISHDYELLMNCADSIVEMKKGEVIDNYELNASTSERLTNFFTK